MIKCNWDAAVDVDGRRMGVGIVIRTHEGEVTATKCSTKPYITDPHTAEAVAADRLLSLAAGAQGRHSRR